MSLDVYLEGPVRKVQCDCPCCGNIHETERRDEYFSGNITHNLGKMAEAANLYMFLWRPEELGIAKAGQLIEPLKEGLEKLELNPQQFKIHNPKNGWGSYEGLVSFVKKYLKACEEHPEAEVTASR